MNTTHVIPKEELSNFERWKLDSLDMKVSANPSSEMPDTDPKKETSQNTEPSASVMAEEQQTPKANVSTEEQIDSVFQQAQENGYAAGFKAGRAAGFQEGKQQAETEVKNEIARIQSILAGLGQELHQIDQQVAEDLLALSLDLAKKMITEALQIRPEFIIPIAQEAIRQLPHAEQHPLLIVHPDDAQLIRDYQNDELAQCEWKISEDEKIERGGCRVEATGSEVDASLSTRWQRVLGTIGQENNWLI